MILLGKKLTKDEAATPKGSTSGKDEMTSKWIYPLHGLEEGYHDKHIYI